MKLTFILFTGLTCLSAVADGQPQKAPSTPKQELRSLFERNLKGAAEQYQFLSSQVPADRFPRSFENGKQVTSNSEWWCSGFYPGTLIYLYEATKEPWLKEEVGKRLSVLEKEQYNKTTHDLGFMMYCSFGNANRLWPSAAYQSIILNSAKSLATRFNPTTAAIRSWDSPAKDYLVIIDNMMNLELLFRASQAARDSSFAKIAVIHANTTIKNHFRPDNSSYHLVNYNPETGVPQVKKTVQGAGDETAWARGQAWGLYGFTVMFRETKNPKYLAQAEKIARFMTGHPNFPKDGVPYWDFSALGIPNALRDASAGAIMASALIELSGYAKPADGKRYLQIAETALRTLSGPDYLAAKGENGGFLLKHGVGNLPAKSEIDTPLSYADYYFVEAMLRYRSLK